MRLLIVAVGRLRAGPEAELLADYSARTGKTGRGKGLGPLETREVEHRSGGGKSAEATRSELQIPDGAAVVAMDERGKAMASPDLATWLAERRDDGIRDCAFLIGGADGLAPDLRARADLTLSMGKMVWPHMLARVMLAEQLYRSASILAGTPYHRA